MERETQEKVWNYVNGGHPISPGWFAGNGAQRPAPAFLCSGWVRARPDSAPRSRVPSCAPCAIHRQPCQRVKGDKAANVRRCACAMSDQSGAPCAPCVRLVPADSCANRSDGDGLPCAVRLCLAQSVPQPCRHSPQPFGVAPIAPLACVPCRVSQLYVRGIPTNVRGIPTYRGKKIIPNYLEQ